MTAPEWGVQLDGDACPNADCDACKAVDQVLEAGARQIAAATGANYDTTDPHVIAHWKAVAGAVNAAMSDALIESGLATLPTGDDL